MRGRVRWMAAASVLAAGCNLDLQGAAEGGESGTGQGGSSSTGPFVATSSAEVTSEGEGTAGSDGPALPMPTTGGPAEEDGDSTATASVDGTTGAGGETTQGEAACDRALMVTGDTNVEDNVDTPLYQRLLDLGFTVTVVDKASSSAADVADNCVVIVSDIGSSADVNTKFRDALVGVVVLEPGLYDDMALVATDADLWWGDGYDDIGVVDPVHALAAGLSGTVSIYEGGGRGSWGVAAENAQIVADWPDDPSRSTLFAYEAGVEMAQAFVAPARRVAFPGGVASVPMTEARIDLFEAAVKWAAGDLP